MTVIELIKSAHKSQCHLFVFDDLMHTNFRDDRGTIFNASLSPYYIMNRVLHSYIFYKKEARQ